MIDTIQIKKNVFREQKNNTIDIIV